MLSAGIRYTWLFRSACSPFSCYSNNRFGNVLAAIMLGWLDRTVAQRVIIHTNTQLETLPTALKSQAGLQIFLIDVQH
jgi:hypothetical protein